MRLLYAVMKNEQKNRWIFESSAFYVVIKPRRIVWNWFKKLTNFQTREHNVIFIQEVELVEDLKILRGDE
jgi:hypothetical protein